MSAGRGDDDAGVVYDADDDADDYGPGVVFEVYNAEHDLAGTFGTILAAERAAAFLDRNGAPEYAPHEIRDRARR